MNLCSVVLLSLPDACDMGGSGSSCKALRRHRLSNEDPMTSLLGGSNVPLEGLLAAPSAEQAIRMGLQSCRCPEVNLRVKKMVHP